MTQRSVAELKSKPREDAETGVDHFRDGGKVVPLFPDKDKDSGLPPAAPERDALLIEPEQSEFAKKINALLSNALFAIDGQEDQFPARAEANKHMRIIVKAALQSEHQGRLEFEPGVDIENNGTYQRIRAMIKRYLEILKEQALMEGRDQTKYGPLWAEYVLKGEVDTTVLKRIQHPEAHVG